MGSPTPLPADFASTVALEVNGEPLEVEVPNRTTLLALLRNRLQLTGAKEACDRGHCGACTVLLDGEPIYACARLAVECGGARVTTVEGLLAGGQLTETQRRFIEADALQCGFCIPGQVVAAHALLARHPRPDPETVRRELAGNLCRCGSYRHILDALVEPHS